MGTFVLVHGAWGGGHDWRLVRPLLQAAGFATFTPTLTGLGERSHLMSPMVNLDTHIQDVVNVLVYEDLNDVVLVGHSYGGMVVTGVLERLAERISQVIYLDAYVPDDGQTLLDFAPQARREALAARVQEAGFGWLIPPYPASNDWEQARSAPQPWATYSQSVRLTSPAAAAIPRTYILCTEKEGMPFGDPFVQFAERARAEPGWTYRELPTGHDAATSLPDDVARLLLEAANGGSRRQ